MSFWLEYGNREAPELVAFASDLAQTAAGRPGICFGPLNGPTTLEPLYRQARVEGNAIVEPHGYLLDLDHTARSRNHFPWLAQTPRPATQPEWEQWMRQASTTSCPHAYAATPAPRPLSSLLPRGWRPPGRPS